MSLLRHLSLALDWLSARTQIGEDLRDIDEALGARVTGRLITIAGYVATGATTARIPLGANTKSGRAAVLVRATLSRDVTADIAVSSRLNFVQSAAGLSIYEPSGLLANTPYDLTFLVMD